MAGSEDREVEEQYSHYAPSQEEIGQALFSTTSIGRSFSRQDDDDEDTEIDKPPIVPSSGSSDDTEKNSQGPQKVGFFHPTISHLRWKILIAHLKIWFYLGSLVIAAFSVYWGSLYNRQGNLHRLKMLVVIEDAQVGDIEPLIGNQIISILQTPQLEYDGTWEIYNGTEEINSKFNNPENVTEAILEQVHHRHYWSSIHVFPNSTFNQYQLYTGEIDEVPTVVEYIYESGRDISTIKPFIVPILQNVQTIFQNSFGDIIGSNLISKLSDNQKLNLVDNTTLVTTLPHFEYVDYRPYVDSVLLAPLQVGLIYLIIVSFFQFNFFAEVHNILIPVVHIPQYLLYRIFCTHLSYLIISLFISAVSAIFHVNFELTFGRAGFVVYWLSTYLTMAAVGGANENMAMLIFTHKPPFLGFWLISFVILNVSPSFSPMALISPFYRYGYMMPIHHSNEISKVIFMDLWKGDLGLNYGILVVWIVLNTLLLPIVLKHVGGVMAKRAKAAAAAAAAKQQPAAPPVNPSNKGSEVEKK